MAQKHSHPGRGSAIRATTLLLVLLALLPGRPGQAQASIELHVDLSDAPRRLLHVTELVPAHAGTNSVSYPQWIPSEELPGGPIDNLAGLVFRAGTATGAVLPWRRDLVDMYTFHVDAPAGTTTLSVTFDVLEVPSRANSLSTKRTSAHVVMLEPSDIVLYPSGVRSRDISVTATVHLPAGWVQASALRTGAGDESRLNGSDTTFRTVSLDQFVDSPILAGDHCRQYPLAPELHPAHTLNVCAETAAQLSLAPEFIAHMESLVRQADLLFNSHHYAHYDFLVADSSHLDGDSEEHTESADYMVKSLDMKDPATARFLGYLLPHEFTHSWCGKYRRPEGDTIPNFNTPMRNDLLWVYEGSAEYYGNVLSARSGFRSAADTRSRFDQEAWDVDQPGRRWRPVQDTADASAILRSNDPAWSGWRLSQDYYQEGTLLWLEADMKIRELSHGTRSLDDFAAAFFGANPGGSQGNSGPGVYPFTFEAVVDALNGVASYDWADFWTTRLNALTPRPPIAGLAAAGYSYTDSEKPDPDEAAFMQAAQMVDMTHSLGFLVLADGTLNDVWVGSPAYAAGLGPDDKLTLVNGKPYSAEALTAAVREAKETTGPIVLTAARDDETATYPVNYHGGEKYVVLVPNGRPDALTGQIFRALPERASAGGRR